MMSRSEKQRLSRNGNGDSTSSASRTYFSYLTTYPLIESLYPALMLGLASLVAYILQSQAERLFPPGRDILCCSNANATKYGFPRLNDPSSQGFPTIKTDRGKDVIAVNYHLLRNGSFSPLSPRICVCVSLFYWIVMSG
jgi:hypothetical protein